MKKLLVAVALVFLILGIFIGILISPLRIKTETILSSSLNNYIMERDNYAKQILEEWNFTITNRPFTPSIDISYSSLRDFGAKAAAYGVTTIYRCVDNADLIIKIYYWFGVVKSNIPIILCYRVW